MATLEKIDLNVLHQADYVAPKKPVLVTIARAAYLGITGQGAPGGEEFSAKIGALYAMAYTVKMTRKFGGQQDYTIGKLEMLYWLDGAGTAFDLTPKEQWKWRMLIRTPEFVRPKELAQAAAVLRQRGKAPEAHEVKLESLSEGRCVQMLHVGPYERIGETCAQMRAFAQSQGLKFHGVHHEIYLSDPRRVAPEKLKTILREPVKKA